MISQHNYVMFTSKHKDYQYKSNLRRGYFPRFNTFIPPFFHRGGTAPVVNVPPPPPPIATVV